MEKLERIKYILIDFDGVISKNSLDITLSYTHDYINQNTPYHFDSLKNYYRSVNSFNLHEGVQYLFKSLGIEETLDEFNLNLVNLKQHKGQKINIEPDFLDFISFCKKIEIKSLLFSLADNKKIENLLGYKPDYLIWPKKESSKANPKTYENIYNNILQCSPKQIMIIDDDPIVLRSAKSSGLKTLLMKNTFFESFDLTDFNESIDNIVDSFNEIKMLMDSN